MPIYIIKAGDCLSSIAISHGFSDWHKIYHDSSNAEFRQLRPNPNVIFPGDKLNIPEAERRLESCATEQRHQFLRPSRTTLLRLKLLDDGGEPLAGIQYLLHIELDEIEGETDDDGMLEEKIPADLKEAQLSLRLPPEKDELQEEIFNGDKVDQDDPGNNPDATGPEKEASQTPTGDDEASEPESGMTLTTEILLNLGKLDPIDTTSGIQARLINAGYSLGPIDGIRGPMTEDAIKLFQNAHDLAVDGICGPKTQGKLEKFHGS
jgi:hypothetical protein